MRLDFFSIFPELIHDYFKYSVLNKAMNSGLIEVFTHNPRDFPLNKQNSVDDTPYGGGAGMLLAAAPFYNSFASMLASNPHLSLSADEFWELSAARSHETKADRLNQDIIKSFDDKSKLPKKELADIAANLNTKSNLNAHAKKEYQTELPQNNIEINAHHKNLNSDSHLNQIQTKLKENSDTCEVICLTPNGIPFNQQIAKNLSLKKNLIFFCGRYEGFDERIKNLATLELSIGDYILTGGELGALTVADACSRLVPRVLGDHSSYVSESFSKAHEFLDLAELTKRDKLELSIFISDLGLKLTLEQVSNLKLLEHPHYTRPAEYLGQLVPAELLTGDHKKIMIWRFKKSIEKTLKLRPDLLQL
jgi:tRNA (guanine37-N1)-methyltransferase